MRISPPWAVVAILVAGLTTTVLLVPDTKLTGAQASRATDAETALSWPVGFWTRGEIRELKDED